MPTISVCTVKTGYKSKLCTAFPPHCIPIFEFWQLAYWTSWVSLQQTNLLWTKQRYYIQGWVSASWQRTNLAMHFCWHLVHFAIFLISVHCSDTATFFLLATGTLVQNALARCRLTRTWHIGVCAKQKIWFWLNWKAIFWTASYSFVSKTVQQSYKVSRVIKQIIKIIIVVTARQ